MQLFRRFVLPSLFVTVCMWDRIVMFHDHPSVYSMDVNWSLKWVQNKTVEGLKRNRPTRASLKKNKTKQDILSEFQRATSLCLHGYQQIHQWFSITLWLNISMNYSYTQHKIILKCKPHGTIVTVMHINYFDFINFVSV